MQQVVRENTFNVGRDVHITASLLSEFATLKKEIAEWLQAPDPSLTHKRFLDEHLEGTGRWLLISEVFTSWKAMPASTLWITGKPGNGKSVLCSMIIKSLQEDSKKNNIPVLYYYFNFREPATQTCENLLRSLILQFLHSSPTIPPSLEEFYLEHNSGTREPSVKDLTSCLISLIRSVNEVRLVGDAFDECTEWNSLWYFLSKIVESNCPSLRFLITSRSERHIRDAVNSLRMDVVDISCMEISEDISRYVSETLAFDPRFARISVEGKALARDHLIVKAGGMFRWVALQLNAVSKCRSLNTLRQTLSSFPPTLEETYERILQKVDIEDHPHVYRILQWLCFARRPLRVEELAGIYVVADSIRPPFGDESVLFNPEDILDLCSGLLSMISIETDGKPPWRLFESRTILDIVELSHFSVKEYLISTRAASWKLKEELSHAFIIRSAIAYYLHAISDDDTTLSTHRLMMRHSLAEYSAEYTYHHLNNLSPRDYPTLTASFRLLLDPMDSNVAHRLGLIHFRLYDAISAPISVDSFRESTVWSLSLAARLGLTEMCKLLLSFPDIASEIDTVIHGYGYDCGPPLLEAIITGQADVVRVLLEAGAHPTREVGAPGTASYYGTPVEAAAANGHTEILHLLINHGADVNFDGNGNRMTAIQAAAMEGELDIVELLIQVGADINPSSGKVGTPIQAAASYGHPRIVEMLISAGADVNARGEIQTYRYDERNEIADVTSRSPSALSLAREMGFQSIVKMLEDAGAEEEDTSLDTSS